MQEMGSRHEILLILLGDQCHASSGSSCWVWGGGEGASSHLWQPFLPPAMKLGQGYVLHVSVILFTGGRGGIPACIAGGIPACLAAGLQGGDIAACLGGL